MNRPRKWMALNPKSYTQWVRKRYFPYSVGGREDLNRRKGVDQSGSIFSADLGGSSKDSSEKLEHRSGEGFHNNGNRL